MSAAEEFIGALAAPADLAVQLGRGIGDDAVFRIEVGLLAEAAADVTDQHADALLRPLQHGVGKHVAGRGGRLRLHMQDQPAGFRLDLGNGRARLHRGRDQALAYDLERDRVRGIGKRLRDLGRVAIAHRRDDVVGRLRPHHRRAGLDRLDRIGHRRQHLIVDVDGFRRGLGQRARGRDNDGDTFAGEANNLMRQQAARRHRHRRAVRALEDRQGRDDADIVGDEIGAGKDGFDTGHGARRRAVDALDPAWACGERST